MSRDLQIIAAYKHAFAEWAATGIPLDGRCKEICELMQDYLKDCKIKSKLVRYTFSSVNTSPEKITDYHWCIRIKRTVYDPTILHATWGEPLRLGPEGLYVVGSGSPHKKWKHRVL